MPSATPYTESKRRIFINLAKLQTATLSSLKDDAIVMETLLPSDRPYVTLSKAGKQEIEPKHLLKFAKQEPKKKVPCRVVLTRCTYELLSSPLPILPHNENTVMLVLF